MVAKTVTVKTAENLIHVLLGESNDHAACIVWRFCEWVRAATHDGVLGGASSYTSRAVTGSSHVVLK
jgi:hypothetical protein